MLRKYLVFTVWHFCRTKFETRQQSCFLLAGISAFMRGLRFVLLPGGRLSLRIPACFWLNPWNQSQDTVGFGLQRVLVTSLCVFLIKLNKRETNPSNNETIDNRVTQKMSLHGLKKEQEEWFHKLTITYGTSWSHCEYRLQQQQQQQQQQKSRNTRENKLRAFYKNPYFL